MSVADDPGSWPIYNAESLRLREHEFGVMMRRAVRVLKHIRERSDTIGAEVTEETRHWMTTLGVE